MTDWRSVHSDRDTKAAASQQLVLHNGVYFMYSLRAEPKEAQRALHCN
jgi:hypothetical protein